MYCRTLSFLFISAAVLVGVSAAEPKAIEASLEAVERAHHGGSCPNYCWLRDGAPALKIKRDRCNGKTKSCTRDGKKGFTCRCDDKPDKPDDKPGPVPHMCDKPYLSPLGASTYFSRYIDMQSASGYFDFYWGLYKLMDKVTIYQGGFKIFSTEAPIGGSGKSKILLNGKSMKIKVVVNSHNPASLWDFFPSCTY